MQLKLKRSQRTGGVLGGTAFFCLDARVALTPSEQQSVARYKLGGQVLYSSENAKRTGEQAGAAMAGAAFSVPRRASASDWFDATTHSIGGGMKAIALGAMSALSLRITINSLQQGQHIECKSLDEVLGAEEALMSACRNLRGYLDAAASFDGREVVVDFAGDEEILVASAVAPLALATSGASEPSVSEPYTYQPEASAMAAAAPEAAIDETGYASTPTSLTELHRSQKVLIIILALTAVLIAFSMFHVSFLITAVAMLFTGLIIAFVLHL